jgi:hypothetical protein
MHAHPDLPPATVILFDGSLRTRSISNVARSSIVFPDSQLSLECNVHMGKCDKLL